MGKTFAQELKGAYKRQYHEDLDLELIKRHRERVRDENHAFRNVDMPKTDRTGGRLRI